jgi:hypothetical protein
MSPLASVTQGRGDIGKAGEAWEAVRADEAIQFAPVQAPAPPEPPGWLTRLFEWLGELFEPLGRLLGSSWPVLKWVLLAAGIALLLVILWRLLEPAFGWRRKPPLEGEDQWLPAREEALALLGEADRLAAEGRYDEATHLLLRRSVGQIAAARPEWVEPSSTARELAALAGLPQAARSAFATIAEPVERSLFALQRLGWEDWQTARRAYADFALQPLREGA